MPLRRERVDDEDVNVNVQVEDLPAVEVTVEVVDGPTRPPHGGAWVLDRHGRCQPAQ